MNSPAKNKLMTWLVVLLLVANATTITMFWLGKRRPPPPKGAPNEFLIRELKLDTKQQEQLDVLIKQHRQAAEDIRGEIKSAKDSLFELVKNPNATDSAKQTAAAACSKLTEQLDVLTVNHFQKIRSLCTPEQQKKFDEIIHEVTAMMGQPRPPMGPGGYIVPPPPDGPPR